MAVEKEIKRVFSFRINKKIKLHFFDLTEFKNA